MGKLHRQGYSGAEEARLYSTANFWLWGLTGGDARRAGFVDRRAAKHFGN
jgi:hypothetical protein